MDFLTLSLSKGEEIRTALQMVYSYSVRFSPIARRIAGEHADRRGDRRRTARLLDRRVEGDDVVVLVEDVAAPERDFPFLIVAAQADLAVHRDEAGLQFVRIEIRSGVVARPVVCADAEEAARIPEAEILDIVETAVDRPQRRLGEMVAVDADGTLSESAGVSGGQPATAS